MESKESIRAAKVLVLAGGILVIGIVVGFMLSGNLSLSPVTQAKEAGLPAVTSSESPFTQIADRWPPKNRERHVGGRFAGRRFGCCRCHLRTEGQDVTFRRQFELFDNVQLWRNRSVFEPHARRTGAGRRVRRLIYGEERAVHQRRDALISDAKLKRKRL